MVASPGRNAHVVTRIGAPGVGLRGLDAMKSAPRGLPIRSRLTSLPKKVDSLARVIGWN